MAFGSGEDDPCVIDAERIEAVDQAVPARLRGV
jgi:hypothetical protein